MQAWWPRALKVPIEFQAIDEFRLREYLNCPGTRFPEPVHSPCSDWGLNHLRRLLPMRRVALTGYGGDPTLSSLLTQPFPSFDQEEENLPVPWATLRDISRPRVDFRDYTFARAGVDGPCRRVR